MLLLRSMGNKRVTPTICILPKTQELHHGVLWQLSGVWFGHIGVAGAGKHMAPVQSPGVDTSLLDLQQQTFLDASKDAVGVFNLV